MENLIFSLNATLPIFALMVLGNVFRRLGLIDDKASAWMNKFVFKVALPVLLFEDLSGQDFAGTWDGKFVAFCVIVTAVSIALIYLLSRIVIRDTARRGEFIQGAYRSSAALLGIAFIRNIYGSEATGMGPLMILGSVPFYNIFAVIILTLTADNEDASAGTDRKVLMKSTLKGIITNPIIIGIAAGLLWSLVGIPKPRVIGRILSDIGALATPLGLMSMGATFEYKKALNNIKPALLASFIKLFALVGVFLPIAVRMGFAGEQIVAILVMLGSATTVSCFIMAKSMGHEGTLSSSIIMMTTFGCSFSLAFWLFVLRSFGII